MRRFVVFLASWVALAAAEGARADVGGRGREPGFFTPGPLVELGLDGAFRFGGEVALTQYFGKYGLGAAAGFTTPGRIYLEAQPVLVLSRKGHRVHNLVLGLNPGFVVDVTGRDPRYGGQLTFWFTDVFTDRGQAQLASPIVPYVRGQAIVGVGASLTFGVTVKLPLRAF